jgi:4'-phosphopantetheinyl transferase EntD
LLSKSYHSVKNVSQVICPSVMLKGIFPQLVATAEIRGYQGCVCLGEYEVHAQNMNRRRRDEFAAGRLCAAAALGSLGCHSVRVDRGAQGSPIWPAGVVGSIAHTNNIAAAAVARSDGVQAIGLDIEQVGAVERVLWPTLFSETEKLRLARDNDRSREAVAAVMFAAKEAFYKAQWPITREWLDFLDVEVELNGETFDIVPRSQKSWLQCFGKAVKGVFAIEAGVVAAAILVSTP